MMVPASLRPPASPPVRQADNRPAVGSFPIVRAENFELVDQSGVTRAWLGPLDDGAVVLAMRDQTGAIRVVLIADAADTGVALSNHEGSVIWQAP
jgi:hypothetical protein